MTIRSWHRLGRKLVLGSGMILGWASTDALWAQGPAPMPVIEQDAAPVRRNYMKDRVIDLPITMEDSARALIQEIHLYVKEKADAPWVLRDKGSAAQKAFRFQATQDGEFWFAMVTIDRQGRRFPQDLQNERPGLIVVIDTQRPVAEMINVGNGPEGQLVQCTVQDQNIDNARVRFFYQGGDKVFRALDPIPGKAGVFCIPPQAVSTGVVRLVAEDLAGNQTVREEHLQHMATSNTPAASTQQASVAPRIELNAKSVSPQKEFTVEVQQDTTDSRVPQRLPSSVSNVDKNTTRPDGTEGPRFEGQASDPIKLASEKPAPSNEPNVPVSAPTTNGPKRQIVNNTRIYLDYQIETTSARNMGAIEVWLTRDQGKKWEKIASDTQRKNPIGVDLPGEGVFGLTLLVAGPQGATSGPAPGEAPDWNIEVDTTKPMAQITQMHVTHDKGQPIVQVQWSVKDTNLGDTPVELSFAATAQGPWVSIAKGLKAEGQHQWTPPAQIGTHVHLQLMARDTAGNECIVRTTEPVNLVDQSRPRIFIREVRTEAPSAPVVMPPVPARPTQQPATPNQGQPQPLQIIQTAPRN